MKTMTDKEAREDFDALLTAGKREPVEITRNGERIGLFLSDADVELIEDLLLAQKTEEQRKSGTLGVAASSSLLDRLRHAQD